MKNAKTYRTSGPNGAPVLDTPEKLAIAKARLTRKACPTCGAKRGAYCRIYTDIRGETHRTVCFGRLDGGEAPVVEALEDAGYKWVRR